MARRRGTLRSGFPHRFLVFAALAAAGLALVQAEAPARTLDFNRGWQFTKGDSEGAAQMTFDDFLWETVRTPHDWAIAGPFDPQGDGHSGKLPWRGVGWYRKWLMIDAKEEGSQVYLDFDGVMAFAKVYVNGEPAGEWDYGYTSFRVDITPLVRFGRANVVAVRVDTRRHGTRWYPGAGIYRKVTLVVKPPVHLAHWGTQVTTPEVSDQQARVVVANQLDSYLGQLTIAEVDVELHDPDGNVFAQSNQEAVVEPSAGNSTRHEFSVPNPRRWDVAAPNLYTAVTSLRIDGRVVDRRETRFGIRTFEFLPDDGFHLNGRRVQLKGVNLHHDLGPLGAAFNLRARQRQLEILKDMGINALRTSHNPSEPELLDLCDEMGILVWDELFDKWDKTADRIDGEPDLASHAVRNIRSLAMRDRNHPSVVVWSIGNEILNRPDDSEGKSRERVKMMRDLFLKHDPSRPVGIGCHIPETANTDILADLDLTGWNYLRRYWLLRERFPEMPIVYTESASTVSTRGYYDPQLPGVKCEYPGTNRVSSYDLSSVAWGDIPDVEFTLMGQDHFVAGEFVWTGFDYLGEPSPFTEAARSSFFGIVDLCGIPKDRFYLYRSYWRPDTTTVHIVPHWNWAGREGQTVPVFVYTNGDSAELFVNGVSQGVRRKGERPPEPKNLALDAPAESSSSAPGCAPGDATSSDGPGWVAAEDDDEAWWQVDLGSVQPVRCLMLEFEKHSKLYGYEVQISDDGATWRTLVGHRATHEPRYSGVPRAVLPCEDEGRYVRISFNGLLESARPGLKRVGVYPQHVQSPYYRPTYDYRLRWDDVVYEPGELRAVAYRDGEQIGTAEVRTAGPPHRIRLSPDRGELTSSGEDLSFVLVEAVDADGNVCPLAEDTVQFTVMGPATIAAVGNGNPLSMEPFQSSQRKLFYGKAMLIVRADEGLGGEIQIEANAEGLLPGTATLRSARPQ